LLERKLKNGEALTEWLSANHEVVKVAMSPGVPRHYKQYGYETPYSHAPEL